MRVKKLRTREGWGLVSFLLRLQLPMILGRSEGEMRAKEFSFEPRLELGRGCIRKQCPGEEITFTEGLTLS